MPFCSCSPGYTGSGYGPNGCAPLTDICQLQNPCANGQCLVSAGLPHSDYVMKLPLLTLRRLRLEYECRHATGNEAKSVESERSADTPGDN